MASEDSSKLKRLGEVLVENGWATETSIKKALEIQSRTGKLIGEILVNEGFVQERHLYQALAIQYDMAYVNFNNINIPQEVTRCLSKGFAYQHNVMPLVQNAGMILVAIPEPKNPWIESELHQAVGNYELKVALAAPNEIRKAIAKYYGPE